MCLKPRCSTIKKRITACYEPKDTILNEKTEKGELSRTMQWKHDCFLHCRRPGGRCSSSSVLPFTLFKWTSQHTNTLMQDLHFSNMCFFSAIQVHLLICRYFICLSIWRLVCVCVWPAWVFIVGRHIIFCSQAERKLLFSSLKIICHRPKRESVLPEYIAYVAAFVPLQFFRSNTPHSSQTLFELSCTRYTSLGTCPQERILDSSQHWTLQFSCCWNCLYFNSVYGCFVGFRQRHVTVEAPHLYEVARFQLYSSDYVTHDSIFSLANSELQNYTNQDGWISVCRRGVPDWYWEIVWRKVPVIPNNYFSHSVLSRSALLWVFLVFGS